MLYNILLPYASKFHFANVMTYISFRSIVSMLMSFLICVMSIRKFINYIKNTQKYAQPIRTLGPDAHFLKYGTPTMGGVFIILSTLISTLLLSDWSNCYVWIVLFALLSSGLLGFADDYLKIRYKNHDGVSAKVKFLVQSLIGLFVFLLIEYFGKHENSFRIFFPFLKHISINLGYFYLIFCVIVLIASSNAVNLTDGLDGLAIGSTIICISVFTIITYVVGNIIYAKYLHLSYVAGSGELTILCSALIGSGLGFLWYNAMPAQLFMGDTGSLALGGVIGAISIVTKHEMLLCIVGGVFVIEAMSVIIQVYYYKISGGKRFFKMAPIHHHFEKLGWSESKVVVRFWILSLIFALIGLIALKLR